MRVEDQHHSGFDKTHFLSVRIQLCLKPSNPAMDLCHGLVRRSHLHDYWLHAVGECDSGVRSLHWQNYQS